jgi:hypothetical protein
VCGAIALETQACDSRPEVSEADTDAVAPMSVLRLLRGVCRAAQRVEVGTTAERGPHGDGEWGAASGCRAGRLVAQETGLPQETGRADSTMPPYPTTALTQIGTRREFTSARNLRERPSSPHEKLPP